MPKDYKKIKAEGSQIKRKECTFLVKITQWQSICLACRRPWVTFPSKTKRNLYSRVQVKSDIFFFHTGPLRLQHSIRFSWHNKKGLPIWIAFLAVSKSECLFACLSFKQGLLVWPRLDFNLLSSRLSFLSARIIGNMLSYQLVILTLRFVAHAQ